ncbi:uncharacterized protein K452DRAFT_320042 [Aplosporella prunicola CBS 121167]|uniref:C2H2-type domain-containing protein n=1 Tax=Aplosporella prunicola CBS 121167 TaxID=1176127 RepID=A0A6A6BBU5_9PEZI|nr:uncharacterized protein K452DRAFT_320042 [Aplosporella prunicola CBS 121167]KAF2139951.1 hypothetical protein K452DRAFT_320042 [Aplosporella prunicola CBS 121167]
MPGRMDQYRYCRPCGRSYNNIEAHYRNSRRHAYCGRCERHFTSWEGLDAHWANSSAHNFCSKCDFDGEDEDELKTHCYETGCAVPCEGCAFLAPSKRALHKHLAAVFGCHKCHKHCDNHNNLRQHMLTHAPARVECWGCDALFVCLSRMVVHLEQGFCPSGCSRRGLHSLVPCELYGLDARPFCCPTCDSEFRLLSALLHHIEINSACNEDIREIDFVDLQELFEDEYLL